MPVASLDDIKARLGSEIGVSHWIEIGQDRIDRFAQVTGDSQFIHVDPDAAAATPFGGTIAHGFLTLSLLSEMGASAMLIPETCQMVVNYGFDKVRFIAPVRSGKRVRGRFTLVSADEKKPGHWHFLHKVTVEIEGEERPALQADWIGLIIL
jgi:acyl dehydratase